MNYLPPWWARNGHFQSIYPSLFRKLNEDCFKRERIETPDHDFIDLDWAKSGKRRLLILTHGLEGHSRRPYVLGMAHEAIKQNWDVLAWNFRSCSGEPNRKVSSYHSGATNDIAHVISYALQFDYDEVCLIGFSIGGNKTLLYLSKYAEQLSPKIKAAVTFSVPCDLSSSSTQLAKLRNRIYMKNFLMSLKTKLKQKQEKFPGEINLEGFHKIKSFEAFDGRYTAPLNGFDSAQDYWRRSSSLPHLENINRPTLMISALDDPFLTPQCYPYEEAARNPALTLETPEFGGHVGFMSFGKRQAYWSEKRGIEFINAHSEL